MHNRPTPDNERYRAYFKHLARTLELEHISDLFEGDYILSDDLYLHLDILTYNANAPTVILVPGTGLYALCYANLMHLIYEQGFNVVGLDPRGHGRSEGRRGDYTIDELVRDVQAAVTYAIKRFNPEVSVLGSSQGGIVTFYTAAADSRPRSIICQNLTDLSHLDNLNITRTPWLMRLCKPAFVQLADYLPNINIPINLYIDIKAMEIEHFGNVYNFLSQDPLALTTISIRAMKSLAIAALAKPVEEITTPTLILQAEKDTIFSPAFTRRFYQRLQCKKQMTIFPSFTHTMLSTHPKEIVPTIVTWLRQIHKV